MTEEKKNFDGTVQHGYKRSSVIITFLGKKKYQKFLSVHVRHTINEKVMILVFFTILSSQNLTIHTVVEDKPPIIKWKGCLVFFVDIFLFLKSPAIENRNFIQ